MNASSHEEPHPTVRTGPDAQPGPLLHTLEVDGQLFAVRRSRHGGGTDYVRINGRNPDYGFGTSASPDRPEEEHRRSIRNFLGMIDPATGYIAED